MKMETKESVQAKIKALRTEMAKDKAEKIADGRKSGQGLSTSETDNGTGETRAGGDKVVRVWDVPGEFEAVDYTLAEHDAREKVKGPDLRRLLSRQDSGYVLPVADGVTAPEEAKDYVKKAIDMAQGPVLSKLEGASDDLYAWAAARVARSPSSSFEDIMSEMATYGLVELAEAPLVSFRCGSSVGERAARQGHGGYRRRRMGRAGF